MTTRTRREVSIRLAASAEVQALPKEGFSDCTLPIIFATWWQHNFAEYLTRAPASFIHANATAGALFHDARISIIIASPLKIPVPTFNIDLMRPFSRFEPSSFGDFSSSKPRGSPSNSTAEGVHISDASANSSCGPQAVSHSAGWPCRASECGCANTMLRRFAPTRRARPRHGTSYKYTKGSRPPSYESSWKIGPTVARDSSTGCRPSLRHATPTPPPLARAPMLRARASSVCSSPAGFRSRRGLRVSRTNLGRPH